MSDTITAPAKRDFRFPADGGAIKRLMAWVASITAAANNGTLVANALTADETGRAAMQTGFFNEATATAKFAAQAIVGSLLKNATVTATQLAADAVTTLKILDANVTTAKLAANAVTGAKVAAVGIHTFIASSGVDASSAASPVTATGVKIGDKVRCCLNLTDGTIDTTHFESTITANDQISQLTTNLTSKKFFFIVLTQS